MNSRYTIGVDLATDPKKTGVAVIDWVAAPVVVRLGVGANDEDIVQLRAEFPGTIAIDCPFGWPDRFVDFVTAHRNARHEPFEDRNELRLRQTDLWVRNQLRQLKTDGEAARRLTPLSVSADKLGATAMRCAQLLELLEPDLDRSGSDGIVEVYPAASLSVWKSDVKAGWPPLLKAIRATGADLATDDGHCRDAFVCAMTARAVDVGATYTLAESSVSRKAASTEGLIHLPRPNSLLRLTSA